VVVEFDGASSDKGSGRCSGNPGDGSVGYLGQHQGLGV
jgi:hypothetical protein